MRPDFLDTAWPDLAPGGFRRLLQGGAYFPDCRHLASTFPASSLATLITGAWPAEHGIVADFWYDRSAHLTIRASEEDLLATTLCAQIAAEPRSRVFVLTLEQAHAGIMAGTANSRIFWMDGDGRFNTRGQAPDWLMTFNVRQPIESLHNAKWLAVGAPDDAPPLRVLKFDAAHPADFSALYKASPFALAAQFELLQELASKERLGQGDTFDFVCLVCSSSSRLGYETGGRSPLLQQMTLQIDRQLEAMLGQLDHAPGANGFSVVIAGAHGAPPVPAPETRIRAAVAGEAIAQHVERALTTRGLGHVERYLYPFLYLDAGTSHDVEAVRQAAAQAALNLPQVSGYYTAGGACSVRNEWQARFRNSFHLKRSGDLMLSYRPEYVEDYAQGRGISYGSLYNYDVRVPLCFYGPQFRGGVYDSPVESVDVAPTLARALGVAPPSSSMGRALAEALAE